MNTSPAQAGTRNLEEPSKSESIAGALTKTELSSQGVENPLAISSKRGSSSKASAAGAALSNMVKPVACARKSKTKSSTIRSESTAHSPDPTSTKSVDTPQWVSDGGVAKPVRTGKNPVLR